ncbi:MAG: thioredoxin, partial [Candidatus Latescibacterota bacterium]
SGRSNAGESASAPTGRRSAGGIPRLVDLGSTTCVPCKMMAPILEELRTEYEGRFGVEVIDIKADRAAASKYGIRVIPTQIFFDASGRELFRHEGFYAKEDILAKWGELGIDVGAGAGEKL